VNGLSFKNGLPLGKHVKVLHRWELENYLLVPRFLAESMSDDPKKREFLQNEVLDILLEAAEIFKCITANAIVTQEQKKLKPFTKSKNWIRELEGKNSVEVRSTCKEHFLDQLRGQQESEIRKIENRLNVICQKVEAFDHTDSEDPEARWSKVNRILDGKKLLEYLKERCNLGHKTQTKAIARKIRLQERLDQTKYLDPYLEDLMDSFENLIDDW
jgi:hypothetical protein